MSKEVITTIIRITGGIIHAHAADLGQAYLRIVIPARSGTGMVGTRMAGTGMTGDMLLG
jgi:hypothetical protein